MTLTEKLELLAKKDNAVMRALKVEEVRHHLLATNHGELTLKLAKDGTALDYVLVLDSVPFDKKRNEELLVELAFLMENL